MLAHVHGAIKKIIKGLKDAEEEVAVQIHHVEKEFHLQTQAIQMEREQLEMEKEAFEALKRKHFQTTARSEKEALKGNEKVKLNVGGTVFETSKQTLTTEAGTFFHTMVNSGHWQPDENTGEFFIDRDPQFVGEILDYLRRGALDGNIPSLNEEAQQKMSMSDAVLLVSQIDFFQIDSLLARISKMELCSKFKTVEFVGFAAVKWDANTPPDEQDRLMDAAAQKIGGLRAATHEEFTQKRIANLPNRNTKVTSVAGFTVFTGAGALSKQGGRNAVSYNGQLPTGHYDNPGHARREAAVYFAVAVKNLRWGEE
eukprot:TRINITY_DN66941_c0_g1_i1.p1 TRINITY_DN66941_c0_g1~~TRINITY_DN66941_c0_g1_i1.p1  ORF type:complete len:312 (+),score=48.19 TRINITY_DN66941_c0_g1_i1:56-991(+)